MRSGKNDLYEDLKNQILTMELDPDQVLDELGLSERYGLSRTPVREVFRRLAGEGYLDIQENRGARVAPMNHSTLRNFFLVAPMVYAAIGRLAVHNYKPGQLRDLRATQERFRRASAEHDARSMVVANNRFHEIMGQMSGNPYLEPSLGRLLIDHARIGHTFFRPRNSDGAPPGPGRGAPRQFIEAFDRHDERGGRPGVRTLGAVALQHAAVHRLQGRWSTTWPAASAAPERPGRCPVNNGR
jgi:DNA-binding GntR family transcriptional regulator